MKRLNLKYILLVLTTVVLCVWGAAVTIPNTFSPGDGLSSEKMNENFTTLGSAITLNEEKLSKIGSTGFQDPTFNNIVAITSTSFVDLGSVSLPAVGEVNVSLTSHAYVEKSVPNQGRYDFKITRGDCLTGITVGATFWRPNNDESGSFTAIPISFTGFDTAVNGPVSYHLCARKFDAGVSDGSVSKRGLNALWTP